MGHPMQWVESIFAKSISHLGSYQSIHGVVQSGALLGNVVGHISKDFFPTGLNPIFIKTFACVSTADNFDSSD